MYRKPKFILTKIIATYGPACSDIETLKSLIESGVRVFRINFSHGTFDEYKRAYSLIRQASFETHIEVGIMGDLSGPKIRIGEVVKGGVFLEKGQTVKFVNEKVITGKDKEEVLFSTKYDKLIDDVKISQTLLLDDGAIKLKCIHKADDKSHIKCQVLNEGLITSNKGLNMPDTELSIPSLTKKDLRCVDFAIETGFDFLALSFVKTAEDVKELISYLEKKNARPRQSEYKFDESRYALHNNPNKYMPVISKIEKPQAVKNINSILEVTDAIMVARGDLGVEMDLAELAITQKKVINKCFNYGVPVIVATQMLQSMIDAPSPTRAEVSDIANAIVDGADCVMLSGETSVGKYPVETVEMMNSIAENTNLYLKDKNQNDDVPEKLQASKLITPAIAHGVKTIVKDIDAKLIVIWSHSDGMAVYLSKHHLKTNIIACSSSREVLRRMSMMYGIRPIHMEEPESPQDFIDKVDEFLSYRRWVNVGDPIVLVMGNNFDTYGMTDRIFIHHVGD